MLQIYNILYSSKCVTQNALRKMLYLKCEPCQEQMTSILEDRLKVK